jgi:hypothetical protein
VKQSLPRKADDADMTALARMDNMGRQSWKYSMKNHKTLLLVCSHCRRKGCVESR